MSSSEDCFSLPSKTSILESEGVVIVSLLCDKVCFRTLQPQNDTSLRSLDDVVDELRVECVDHFL